MSNEMKNSGDVLDTTAEVVGSKQIPAEPHRRPLHTMWAWRKTIGVLIIVAGLAWLGQDMFTNPNSNITPVVNQAVDKAVNKMSGPSSTDLSRIHQSVYQYGVAVRSGTETKLSGMWRNTFRSESYVRTEALRAAITAIDNLRAEEEELKSPEAGKEVDVVKRIFLTELDIIQAGKKVAVASVK